MKRMMIGVLTVLMMALGAPASLDGQTKAEPPDKTAGGKPSDSEKIRQRVEAFGVGHRVTIVLRNGNEYYGALGEPGADSFELSEIDLNQKITIAYSEVKTVRSGFGNPNQFNGKRWRPGWHIAAVVAVVGVTVGLLIAGSVASR
ncbi:MAG TPA: hypothetical protein VLM38_12180 [Blastocatellia bacterium]|nr:hypothetical protein [Blastocatellia bacterium]